MSLIRGQVGYHGLGLVRALRLLPLNYHCSRKCSARLITSGTALLARRPMFVSASGDTVAGGGIHFIAGTVNASNVGSSGGA